MKPTLSLFCYLHGAGPGRPGLVEPDLVRILGLFNKEGGLGSEGIVSERIGYVPEDEKLQPIEA